MIGIEGKLYWRISTDDEGGKVTGYLFTLKGSLVA